MKLNQKLTITFPYAANYSHKPKVTKRDIIKSFVSIPKDIVSLHKKFITLPNSHKSFWVFVAVGSLSCLAAFICHVVSTSSCPVFLTNEMSGWLKLYRVIAKAEIVWFRGIFP